MNCYGQQVGCNDRQGASCYGQQVGCNDQQGASGLVLCGNYKFFNKISKRLRISVDRTAKRTNGRQNSHTYKRWIEQPHVHIQFIGTTSLVNSLSDARRQTK